MTSALVVIDMQQGLLNEQPAPYRSEEVLQNVGDLLGRARAALVPVFHVQHDGGAGDSLAKGSAGWPHHPAVAPREDEPVIEKIHSSAFHDTDFHDRLQKVGIDRLVIAGMQTEYCVDSACRAAAALGYRVVLVADGHTTFDSSALPAERIIAHHNMTLGGAFVELAAARDVKF